MARVHENSGTKLIMYLAGNTLCLHYKKNKKYMGRIIFILRINDLVAPCT